VQPPTEQQQAAVRRRWLARSLIPGVLIAVVAVIATNFRVELLPPSLERESAEFAVGTTQVLVDFPGKSVLLETKNPLTPLAERASVFARLAASPAIRERIANRAGIPAWAIDVRGPYNPDAERIQREPTAERRAAQLRAERQTYRLRFDTEENEAVPIVLIHAHAPTVAEAKRLADAGAAGLRGYVTSVQEAQGLADAKRLHLRRLGRAEAGVVNPGVDRQIAVLVFIAALFAWSVLVLVASSLQRFVRARARRVRDPLPTASRRVLDIDEESVDDPLVGSPR
jgi:hypothetical protein